MYMKTKNTLSIKYNNSISNKKVFHDYVVSESIIAGMILKGNEVKLFDNHQISILNAYVKLLNNKVYLINYNSSETEKVRDIELLVTSKQFDDLVKHVQVKGNVIGVYNIFRNENALYKCELIIGRGAKKYDKREKEKLKEHRKDIKNLK